MVAQREADLAIVAIRLRHSRGGWSRHDGDGRSSPRVKGKFVMMPSEKDGLDQDCKRARERGNLAPYSLSPTDQEHRRAAPRMSILALVNVRRRLIYYNNTPACKPLRERGTGCRPLAIGVRERRRRGSGARDGTCRPRRRLRTIARNERLLRVGLTRSTHDRRTARYGATWPFTTGSAKVGNPYRSGHSAVRADRRFCIEMQRLAGGFAVGAAMAEQFHARLWLNNATRLSGIEWLWSAKRASVGHRGSGCGCKPGEPTHAHLHHRR
jgi:hypothetical protein